MKRLAIVLAGMLFVLAPAAVGYRIGTGQWPTVSGLVAMVDAPAGQRPEAASAASRRVLYWKDPDGKPAYSAVPAKNADGRDFVAVYDDQEPDFPENKVEAPRSAGAPAAAGEKKVIYYRNPMGLPDTSPEPKKDWMGMDYIPVYEGEEDADDGSVKVSVAKIQRAGVRSEPAEMRSLARPVRAPGIAKVDERTIREVTLRTDGYIEKLYVAEMGKHVTAGEPLFRVYSPDIVKAQVDYRIAKEATAGRSRGEAVKDLAGAVQRLENLDVPESVIKALETGKDATPMKIDWPSPVTGVVMEKKVVEGQKVNSGDMLYQIGDLGKIWVIADVAEQDFSAVTVGAPATVSFQALPKEQFQGRVTFILHELDMATRTGKVRIEIANPDHRIKHEMFADVTIDTGSGDAPRLAVPNSSVLDSGVRQVVLVDKGEGRFEPRDVKLGVRSGGYTEITEGLTDGEKVVVSANFLIDAESNLRAALKGFTAGADVEAPKAEPETGPASEGPRPGASAEPAESPKSTAERGP